MSLWMLALPILILCQSPNQLFGGSWTTGIVQYRNDQLSLPLSKDTEIVFIHSLNAICRRGGACPSRTGVPLAISATFGRNESRCMRIFFETSTPFPACNALWYRSRRSTPWRQDDDVRKGHCSFTPLDAKRPSLHKLYA